MTPSTYASTPWHIVHTMWACDGLNFCHVVRPVGEAPDEIILREAPKNGHDEVIYM